MGDESDSSEDCFVVSTRHNFNSKPHLVTVVKSDTGNNNLLLIYISLLDISCFIPSLFFVQITL